MTRRRRWHPTPVLLTGKSHGWRSLVGCSPWGCEELDMTERLHFHFSLSCIGEGNGNPLQCSCLENPTKGGAWWAAVSGVSQSQTRLKRLSSSSSRTQKATKLWGNITEIFNFWPESGEVYFVFHEPEISEGKRPYSHSHFCIFNFYYQLKDSKLLSWIEVQLDLIMKSSSTTEVELGSN